MYTTVPANPSSPSRAAETDYPGTTSGCYSAHTGISNSHNPIVASQRPQGWITLGSYSKNNIPKEPFVFLVPDRRNQVSSALSSSNFSSFDIIAACHCYLLLTFCVTRDQLLQKG